jgi:hypothetical protein
MTPRSGISFRTALSGRLDRGRVGRSRAAPPSQRSTGMRRRARARLVRLSGESRSPRLRPVALEDLIGRVIARASVEVHVRDDSDDILNFLRLDFRDAAPVTFGCASDGQSLRIDDRGLQSCAMAEYGRIQVRAFEGIAAAETLIKVVPLIDDDDVTFGVLLETPSSRVFVFNWGDELNAESELADVVRGEVRRSLPR